MEKCPASIFNDVIGPVMRGQSSSHVAGAARICSLIRMGTNGAIRRAVVDFDVNGSLAESHDGHGSDMGMASGLLGFDLTDPRVPGAMELAKEAGLDIQINILDYGAVHPNNYRIAITSDKGETRVWEAISTGGGMVEVQRYENIPLAIAGDYHELLATSPDPAVLADVESLVPSREHCFRADNGSLYCVNIKTTSAVPDEILAAIRRLDGVRDVVRLAPVLPTGSRADCRVPFSSGAELLEYLKGGAREMWELAALYESSRGGVTEQQVFKHMAELVDIFQGAVRQGLAGTNYEQRILGPQAHLIDKSLQAKAIPQSAILTNVIRNITAIMETKSSMGVIVAAPTVGSAGCLPGTVIGVAEALGLDQDAVTRGMLAAGLIGVFFCEGASFAAEVGGCQFECGAAGGMAAAGVAQMLGGTAEQCLDAASMALQAITGLACDPVANRVEVPCLGKNVMAGTNAVSCAMVALAGYDRVIPLDETITAIYDIGLKLPLELRCTYGGLGKTPASQTIRKRLDG